MKFSTKAIHVGQEPDPTTGAVITPIYQTSTYVQEGIGKHKGYEYARTGNPTRTALEQCLASLENGKYGLCFASGLAAEMNIMNLLKQGDHVVVGEDVYGGTYRLFQRVMTKYGLKFSFVDSRDLSNVEKAITKETRMLWLETPTNPMLQLVDLQAATKIGRSKGLISVVDNTFASPYLQNPLDLGADIVVHSTTKYIGGHSDVVGGAVITSNTELYDELKFHQNACGGVPGPQDCWLTMRGVKTLAVRMEQHQKNAMEIAKLLSGHEGLEKVIYPGLSDHPHHELAKKQMRGFGGMLSIVVKGGQDAAQRFMTGTKLFSLAESLGGVESLMCHPSTMTHGSIPKEDREARGITDGLVRLSVGIEDVEDLVLDIKTALAKISTVKA
ncbi:MAG: cystathionine gamma-synthase [Cyanobacteria bacterium TGS_CYA1]|nr:cystathionine gamma-synthase [Cyanobacteria bacterium TGS_CYA1]MDX2108207.1 cystathionine gamma-synthase [Candidatus Melainabacteria bacterium]